MVSSWVPPPPPPSPSPSWQTITLPSTLASGASFTPDVVLLLTDGSVILPVLLSMTYSI